MRSICFCFLLAHILRCKITAFFWNMQVRARFFLKNVFFVQQKLHI